MSDKTSQGEIIVDSLELRKKYEQKRPKYERLIGIVELILNSAVDMKLHSIKTRVKDYNSFLEKVERKRYNDPFNQCTDLAGCRVICLFKSQVKQLKKIIQNEFDVIEVTDKITSKKYDQFGYLSLHMLVRLPKNRAKFIEYEGLEDCVCEIQIRTILQEAWAEIEHHLNYKSTKAEHNDALLRKIFSLAGMFEVADSTFEEINQGFTEMIHKKVPGTKKITPLNLYKFSKSRFNWYDRDYSKREERSYFKLSEEIKKIGLSKISELDLLLDKYSEHLKKYEDYHKKKDKMTGRYFTPVGLIRGALALEFGKKFDLVFGLKGYSDRVKKEVSRGAYR